MPLKRQIAYAIIFFLLLILIGVGLFFVSSYLLPGFLESKIISILKKDAGITDFALDFHELDLEGANLGSMRIGNEQNPALVVRSIHIDYSPGGIYQKKIKKVVATGVELYCEYKNGQIGFRGFDLETFLTQLKSDKKKDTTAANQSYSSFAQRIEINNGILIGIVNDNVYRIPFEIDIVPAQDTVNTLNMTARLYPRGQALNISAQIDIKQNRIVSQLAVQKLDLLRFADIFKSIDGLSLAGFASLKASADIQLAPFKVSSIAGRLIGSAIDLSYKNLRFQNRSDNPDIEKPFIIDFNGPDHQNWKVALSGFTAAAPIPATVSDMTATVEPNGDTYKFSGNFKLSFDPSAGLKAVSVPLRFTRPFDLPLKFSAIYPQNGQWRFDLTNGDRKPSDLRGAAFEYENIQISTQFPGVHLSGKGVGGEIGAQYNLRVADVRIQSGDVNVLCPQFVLKGKTDFIQNKPNTLLSVMDLDLSGTAIALNTSKIILKNLLVDGKLQRDKKGAQVITAMVRLANTDIEAAQGSVRLKQAQGTIPLQFPATNSGKKGSIFISAVMYQNLDLGAITAELRHTAAGMAFNAKLKSRLIPELSAKFFGDANFFNFNDYETKARFEISYPATGPEINLGKFFPAAEGFALKGGFLETGSFVIGKNGLSAVVKSSLSDGKLHHPKNKIVIEGIQLDLMFPEIPKMQSAPGQQLRFATATAGGLTIKNGNVEFQIEPPRTLFIEKGQFSWSDGNVYVQSERISPGVDNYNIILFCDRLNLAKVLDQFGAAHVEGKGTVSGRIPLQYQNGRLSFDDGFLFSSPGEGGKIRMKDTEILTAGIPPDTPQYTQMELARKALEDYDYSWAKLNITTEGEDLLLKMQLDGKPAKSLPFVYRKDIGGFAKVEADVEGSTFQGIRLDVNFRLPLNKIMQYKELIQMIQKKQGVSK